MKLKLLIVPSLVILSLILAIGIIKPEYDSLMVKRGLLAQKKTEVDRLESLRSNINALTSSLDQNKSTEMFVLRFYPMALDEERVVDAFNFLAAQSGLNITGMEVKEVVKDQKEGDVLPDGQAMVATGPGQTGEVGTIPADGTPQPLVYQQPKAGSFSAEVKVKGNYDNIKAFLARLYRLDRMYEVNNFSVKTVTKESQTEGETPTPSDTLEASFDARFGFISNKGNKTALGAPIFSKNSFDLEQANALKSWATTSMAELNIEKTGRANPFQ